MEIVKEFVQSPITALDLMRKLNYRYSMNDIESDVQGSQIDYNGKVVCKGYIMNHPTLEVGYWVNDDYYNELGNWVSCNGLITWRTICYASNKEMDKREMMIWLSDNKLYRV
jgi:hypothetical protein